MDWAGKDSLNYLDPQLLKALELHQDAPSRNSSSRNEQLQIRGSLHQYQVCIACVKFQHQSLLKAVLHSVFFQHTGIV